MLSGKIPGPPISATLGFSVTDVSDGEVAFEGAPAFNATNPMRGVHGGWYGAILDSALGCAVMTKVPRGSIYTTLEFKVNITRALSIGSRARAIGTVQHAGRTTCVADAVLRGLDDNKVYATASTTCLIMNVTD